MKKTQTIPAIQVIRQGDVILIPEKQINGQKQKPSEYGHILVEGEATNHCHILEKGDFFKQEDSEGTIGFIQLDSPSKLIHLNIKTKKLTKEHKEIPLESETYRVLRQYEYLPEGYRKIQD